jgi:hypothetical protein
MDNENKPDGGFPPVYECSKNEMELIEQSKKREFSKVTSAISIKDIMMKRSKNITN